MKKITRKKDIMEKAREANRRMTSEVIKGTTAKLVENEEAKEKETD